ncbi:MAG TPA: hypothetical protein VGR95_13555 [Thermoanaerobaculia bacterium]|nr:hypothetical protein [Thermoanaerobaculia bacterium]
MNTNAIRTDISLDPATAGGSITSVKVYWSDANCANAFKVAVFRRNGDLLVPIGQRGPFTVTSNVMTVNLEPAMGIGQGDLIGIVRVGDCGVPGTLSGVPTKGYLSYYGNMTTTTTVFDGQRVNSALAVFGSGTAVAAVTEVIPGVGSVKGVFGSSFKTSIQLINPRATTISGRLIFINASGQGSSYLYSISPGGQDSFDLAFGFTGSPSSVMGLGTMDVDLLTGQRAPQIVARVYNDAGTQGTAGFNEEPVAIGDTGPGGHVISAGSTGFMATPVDVTRTRFNIGVRALFSGADLTAELLDKTGHVLASATKRYPASDFEQVDAASFFGGVPVGASQTVKITVTDGSAIVYGATTDNVTNDPSVQYAIIAPTD